MKPRLIAPAALAVVAEPAPGKILFSRPPILFIALSRIVSRLHFPDEIKVHRLFLKGCIVSVKSFFKRLIRVFNPPTVSF